MKIVKIENRAINLDQIAHTEYKPSKRTDVQSRATSNPSSNKAPASVFTPAQYLIVFSSGAELKLSGTEADEIKNAIERAALDP